MYLPASELQSYKGQWLCPYCMMDMQDEDRKLEEGVRKREEKRRDEYAQSYIRGERCDRCGRDLTIVYTHGGRKLCSVCLEEAKKEWKEVGGEHPPMPMIKVKEEKSIASKIVSVLERKISDALALLKIKAVKMAEEKPAKKEEKIFEEPLVSKSKGPRYELESFKDKGDGERLEKPKKSRLKKKQSGKDSKPKVN